MLTFPQYLGNTLYKHANMLETRYRDMQIFRKHVIETWKLYIMISLRGVCYCISGKVCSKQSID